MSVLIMIRSQKRQREGDATWNFLPNTAKLLIIQFLSLPDLKNVLLVSRSWASVALNPKLWSSSCIVAKSQKDLVDAVNVSRYKFITKLRLADECPVCEEVFPDLKALSEHFEAHWYVNSSEA